MTNSTKKAPSLLGALMLCGEVVLAATIPAAAIFATGIGLPPASAAAAPTQVAQAAALAVTED